jgi:hypothetical protein
MTNPGNTGMFLKKDFLQTTYGNKLSLLNEYVYGTVNNITVIASAYRGLVPDSETANENRISLESLNPSGTATNSIHRYKWWGNN